MDEGTSKIRANRKYSNFVFLRFLFSDSGQLLFLKFLFLVFFLWLILHSLVMVHFPVVFSSILFLITSYHFLSLLITFFSCFIYAFNLLENKYYFIPGIFILFSINFLYSLKKHLFFGKNCHMKN